ncbi:glyoxalase superfamily protein [Asticcacaulis excentricus]|uniref:Putative bleomycin resistance protein n=1 Tax=Asticcacaulis excentricus (strain ATCC 15261 / DSM 4724 / KCTC 12464 / NCIMB 9791 / VKM B-1370 / CB 48) TaxID=573065 RepID=E8RQS9_ASTEC|nr:glyoxalase superfamily protein [Asticcacaulis excentricus]ADU13307.1 putative bleomycin resistance protein [Asticcacaulis excentricus CB 48]
MAAAEDDQLDVLPILPSLSLSETQRFYREFLGFDATVFEDHNYLILRRDAFGSPIELHFWLTDRRELCEQSAVYIRGGGIDRLHQEFWQKDRLRVSPILPRPWGMTEFYIQDPHRNLLKFGRVSDESRR